MSFPWKLDFWWNFYTLQINSLEEREKNQASMNCARILCFQYLLIYMHVFGGTHVQVTGKHGSHFFFSSTMWIPGIKLRLLSLAEILAPFLTKASMGFLGKGLFSSLCPHDFPCILQSHLLVQTIAKGPEETKLCDPPNQLKYVLQKVKMILQYIPWKMKSPYLTSIYEARVGQ